MLSSHWTWELDRFDSIIDGLEGAGWLVLVVLQEGDSFSSHWRSCELSQGISDGSGGMLSSYWTLEPERRDCAIDGCSSDGSAAEPSGGGTW